MQYYIFLLKIFVFSRFFIYLCKKILYDKITITDVICAYCGWFLSARHIGFHEAEGMVGAFWMVQTIVQVWLQDGVIGSFDVMVYNDTIAIVFLLEPKWLFIVGVIHLEYGIALLCWWLEG